MDSPLNTLEVLVLDCQATGASPRRGDLLEIGWATLAADRLDRPSSGMVNSYLVQPPEDAAIPTAVTKVTGIDTDSLAAAIPTRLVWRRLESCVRSTAAKAGQAECPTVIHFARFETPFLKDLYSSFAPELGFPMDVICTHEIARRLFPGLPRKGLRAVAGYLGHTVARQRRCSDHVEATALIWRHMVNQLQDNHSIDSWEALRIWLDSTPAVHRPSRSYPLNPQLRQKLSDQPGIYRMRRSNGDLLYVGKATSLKTRVNSYFRPRARHAEHTLEMLSQARKLDVTTTATALEAAVLECDQIKKYEPPYNIALNNSDRRLSYCNRELSHWTTLIPDGRWIGPFPSERQAQALTALSEWLSGPVHAPADDGMAILNLPPSYQPAGECAREGLALFYQAHAHILTRMSPLRAVAALGAGLWQARLDALAEEIENTQAEEILDEGAAAETTQRVWTPELVQRTVEHNIRHAAHMLRRARWFCQLSESNLAWRSHTDPPSLRLIKIRRGAVTDGQNHAPDRKPPMPEAESLSLVERRQHFDIITYDRLRVITTEIRRLVADDRNPALCMSNGRVLGPDQLRQLLKWV